MAKPKQFGCMSGCAMIVGLGLVVSIGVVVFRVRPPNSQPVAAPAQPVVTNFDKLAEPFDIRVTSVIVKKVDGKFRYFFDLRNHDSKPFDGSVKITLKNTRPEITNGRETFDTKSPIQPSNGTSVFFDVNTGPRSIHGDSSVESFEFVATIKKQVVAEGRGEITSKIE